MTHDPLHKTLLFKLNAAPKIGTEIKPNHLRDTSLAVQTVQYCFTTVETTYNVFWNAFAKMMAS